MKLFRMTRGKRLFLISLALIAISFCACGKKNPDYLATSANIEVGNPFDAESFIVEGEHTAQFADKFAEKYVQDDGYARINEVGKYSVQLVVDGKNYTVKLNVRDTVAPKASARPVVVAKGDKLLASQCITGVEDRTAVTCSFKKKPNLSKTGVVSAVVVLKDSGKNRTEIPVSITVIERGKLFADSYTIEAGSKFPAIGSIVVVNKTAKYLTDVSAINTSLIGEYTLEMEIDGAVYTTKLTIKDTVAPTGIVNPMTIYYGAAFPEASKFVSDIVDKGPVTVSFEADPGQTVTDQTVVRIVLTDQGGNRTVYSVPCSVVRDEEAPKFVSLPKEITADIGKPIIWRALVEAQDDSGTVELSLDTTAVNMNKAGTYTAVLIARDPAGNETRQEIKLVMHDNSVTQEMLDAVCKDIIDKIITEDMTTERKLYAIYRYIINNVPYTGDSPHDDLRREAYLALTTGKGGDCFAFCSASNALISYLGFETQIVRRDIALAATRGNHFWVLVNCGTEENPQWYHHDSCPRRKPYQQYTHMLTDAQLKAMTKYIAANGGKNDYFTFDTSLHPASATEIMWNLGIDSKYYD